MLSPLALALGGPVTTSKVVLRLLVAVSFALSISSSIAQQVPGNTYQDLRWRMIGPFRGGRTRAATGVPSQPNVFYIGQVNGGVWKSDDSGRTWTPIFDHEPTQSIGAIAVAPRIPTSFMSAAAKACTALIFRSATASTSRPTPAKPGRISDCATATRFPRLPSIPAIPTASSPPCSAIPTAPTKSAGFFAPPTAARPGRKCSTKTKTPAPPTSRSIPPIPTWSMPRCGKSREGPWEDNNEVNGTGGGLFKSTDGGNTWHQLTNGLPKDLSQIYVAIAPSDSRRFYATVAVGFGWAGLLSLRRCRRKLGQSNRRCPPVRTHRRRRSRRSQSRSQESRRRLCASTVTMRSSRRRQNLDRIPRRARRRRLSESLDQSQRPQHHSARQRSGRARHRQRRTRPGVPGTTSPPRSFTTSPRPITFPIALRRPAGERLGLHLQPRQRRRDHYSRMASRGRDRIRLCRARSARSRYHLWRRTQRGLEVPLVHRPGAERHARSRCATPNTAPTAPSRRCSRRSIRTSSTTRPTCSSRPPTAEIPGRPSARISRARIPESQPASGNLIPKEAPTNSAASSTRSRLHSRIINTLWAGTDDGLVWITRDGGKNWNNITPPELTPWSKVTQISASHFDDDTAYASVSRFRINDVHPYIYRTHDGGKTWKPIITGLPDIGPVDTVREDPVRKGLLFAGTENAVWVSFDDGDHWQSLQLNLPHTSMRDLWIHDNDLIVATHGRSFWILDDIAPLARSIWHASWHATLISSRPRPPTAFSATPTPTHRFRPTNPPPRIRPMARSSTTISAHRLISRHSRNPRRSRPVRSQIFQHRQARCHRSRAEKTTHPSLLAALLPRSTFRRRHASLGLGSALSRS